jgi:hypothetical protein
METHPDKFLVRSIQLFKSFMDSSPKGRDKKILGDWHRKTHMLYAGNSVRKNPNKEFLCKLVKKHDEIVKEMLKRGMRHNTPLPEC